MKLFIRPGRTRTRDTRFWRPMLYQLNYRPIYIKLSSSDNSLIIIFYAGLFSLCFFVQNFLAAEWAIFILFEFTLNVLAVLCCSVILAFTFCALKGDNINRSLFLASHFISPKYDVLPWAIVFFQLPSGIGPLTSALPMLCSTN